jgi:hypothetical protein
MLGYAHENMELTHDSAAHGWRVCKTGGIFLLEDVELKPAARLLGRSALSRFFLDVMTCPPNPRHRRGVWSGFDASLGGNKPHKVLISMRVFYPAVPFAGTCMAFVHMMMLPTPPRRHA